ncbi:MAG: serine protease [Thermoleophilia bacterium]|nr:serine protease [Thermoleophilia bacterium]
MVGIAQQAGVRSVGLGCGIVMLGFAFTLGGLIAPAPASPPGQLAASPSGDQGVSAPSGTATTSVVNGRPTSISEWPWQVALLEGERSRPRANPRARFFCGGSLIAPDLVLTAAHCVAPQNRRQVRRIEVVSGRTFINRESTGAVSAVKRAILPVDSQGRRRFREPGGVPRWDVALLELRAPLASATIRISGPNESEASKPGRPVFSTGWGVTAPRNRKTSNRLRAASQVMLPNRLCRSTTGRFYQGLTMNCLGGPGANSSTCFGDSGGPLVAAVGGEFRLVGLTSNGDPYCRPELPSVDARISEGPLRRWIRTKALAVSGTDVVGHGGSIAPAPQWCRVPNLRNLTLPRARRLLGSRGCRLGRTHPHYFSGLRRGRISFSRILAGWYAPPNARISVWVAR